MDIKLWLIYSMLAGLCWGTYVPLVAYGGRTLGNSYGSFLCVGMAYFLIAVLVPIVVLTTSTPEDAPKWSATGITFATLAGVAGALGALCVIFATKEARVDPSIRLYIAPIIFALAPVLNTVISLFWHPSTTTGPLHFGLEHLPGWKFYVGIVLTGLGAALVLYSKEESEKTKGPPPQTVIENVSPQE